MCSTSMYAIQVNKVGLKPTTYYTLIGSYKEKLVRTIPGDYEQAFGLVWFGFLYADKDKESDGEEEVPHEEEALRI